MGLTDRQWKNLINDIRQERCILLQVLVMLPSIQLPGSTAPMLITDHLAGFPKKELEQEEIDFDGKLSGCRILGQRYLLIPFTKEIHLKDEVANIYAQFAGQIP